METKHVKLDNNGGGIEEILNEIENAAAEQSLTKNEQLDLRLLAEEMIGMVQSLTGSFRAWVWMDWEDRTFRLHLTASRDIGAYQREQFMSASTDGKNFLAKGFMGKVRELIEVFLTEEAGDRELVLMNYGIADVHPELAPMTQSFIEMKDQMWTLERYRRHVGEDREKDPRIGEAWDELEKSIVANLADNVEVGVRNDKVKLIITKAFG